MKCMPILSGASGSKLARPLFPSIVHTIISSRPIRRPGLPGFPIFHRKP